MADKIIERTPKYQIGVYREGDELPFEWRFAVDKSEREMALRQLRDQYPDRRIEVRLLKGFIHGHPVRWRYSGEANEAKLEVLTRYDEIAMGKRPPTKKQLEKAKHLPMDV